jgi:hypothetical protein
MKTASLNASPPRSARAAFVASEPAGAHVFVAKLSYWFTP